MKDDIFSEKLSGFIYKYSNVLLLTTLVFVGLIVLGIFKIERAFDMKDMAPPGNPAILAGDILGEHFSGDTVVNVLIDSGDKGKLKNSDILNSMRTIQLQLDARSDVASTNSIAQLVMELNYNLNGEYRIPDSKEAVESLWLLIDGKPELENLMDEHDQKSLVSAMTKSSSTTEYNALTGGIETIMGARESHFELLREPTNREQTLSELTWVLSSYDIELPQDKLIKILELLGEKQTPLVTQPWKAASVAYFEEESLCELEEESLSRVIESINNFTGEVTITTLGSIFTDQDRECEDFGQDLETLEYKAGEYDRKKRVDSAFELLQKSLPKDVKTSEDMTKKISGVLFHHLHGWKYIFKKTDNSSHPFIGASGMPFVTSVLDRMVVGSLYRSIFISLLVVFLLLAIYYRSARTGLLIVFPLGLSISMFFGVMGLVNIPLSFTTAFLGAIVLGVGIDYNIHFFHRFHQETKGEGGLREALTRTYATTGRVILTNAFSTGLGMLVLMTSETRALQDFGFLTAMSMFVSFIFAMFLTPTLILKSSFFRKTIEQ